MKLYLHSVVLVKIWELVVFRLLQPENSWVFRTKTHEPVERIPASTLPFHNMAGIGVSTLFGNILLTFMNDEAVNQDQRACGLFSDGEISYLPFLIGAATNLVWS